MSVETLKSAADFRREINTYRALLADTVDLLNGLKYATDLDKHAAEVQVEGINEVLTNGPNSD